jgi:hypothetical protein
MAIDSTHQKQIIRDLGDGLILRRASAEDAQPLSDFNANLHLDEGEQGPNQVIAAWTNDLAAKPHPTFSPEDFTIVEEVSSGKIVSTLNLISQTWSYGGIPFGVGRPELVGTLPEYRNRGLVRLQFDVIHQWSAERGELLQAITGIPYYYRLFGYEMVVNLGGGRAGFTPHIPKLKEGESDPFCIRPAGVDDIPFIHELYQHGCQRSLLSAVWNEELWRYEIEGKSEKNVNRTVLKIILDEKGERVGFYGHPCFNWGSMLAATWYEVKPGVSWAAVTPSLIRSLVATGKELAASEPDGTLDAFGLWFGDEHPAYQVVKDRLPRVRKPYAWYIRVPDLPAFLRHIAPVLEQRLAESAAAGFSGEIRLTFYRSGLKLVFEKSRLTGVEPWQPHPVGGSGDAAFPNLTFYQILFGHRTLDELMYIFPDCWVEKDEHRAVLEAIFPRQSSRILPIS